MANGTLSSYFEKQKKGNAPTGGVSPYSVGAGDAGGTSPTGGGSAGGPSAPSAPKSAAGGGTGFVSFGQYFGANAPAIQQQAQGVVGKAAAPKAPNAPVGAMGLGMARPDRFGPAPTAGQLMLREAAGSTKSPYEAQIAQTSAQFEALNPAAQSGDMGENVSAFDQLLGGGVTQREAKGEQQRLNTLRGYLQTEQNKWQSDRAAEQRIQEQIQREQAAYKAWYADLPQAYKDNYTPEELLAIYEQEGGAKVSGMVSTPGSSL